MPPLPRIPPTSADLAEALTLRYGMPIAQSVLAALGLGASRQPVDEATVQQAIRVADDAEAVMAGVAFASLPAWSAVGDDERFRALARQAGIDPDALDLVARLRLDAALLRHCRDTGPAVDDPAAFDALVLDGLATLPDTSRRTRQS